MTDTSNPTIPTPGTTSTVPASSVAPAAPDAPTPVAFTKGQLVRFEYEDPYDGPTVQYGFVIDSALGTVDQFGSSPTTVTVAWLAGSSGPIDQAGFTAV